AETKGTSPGIAGSRVVHISTRPAGNLLQPPSAVAATDGVFQARVQVQWNDDEPNEDGYRVFRDGNLVAELAANSESYSDFDIAPGKLAAYCVVTFRNDLVDAPQSCDFGWRPPDGAISGSVRAPQTGAQQLAVNPSEPASHESGSIENAIVLPASSELTADLAANLASTSDPGAPLYAAASPFAGSLETAAAAGDSVLICLAPDPDRGLLFDGAGGWVEINGFRRLPGEFTIEFWAKRANADNNEQVLLAIGDSASTQLVSASFTAGGAFRFSVGAADLDYADGAQSGWHHWALTLAPSGARQIVRDGVVVQSDAAPASVIVSGPLVLGSDFGRGDFLAGSLDEIRVWDKVRTLTQIGAAKDHALGGNEAGLLGYWSMNQGSGVAIGDGTGFGRHGLLRDGAYWSASGAIRSCMLADTQGKYTLDAIRYNESTIFTVTPNQEERVFNPPASEITLNTQNPVENQVDFIDVTQLGAGGRVLFEGTNCPVPDVDILVDGVPRSTTQRDGSFLASLSPRPEEAYRFAPRKVNPDDASDAHSFVPSSTIRIVDRALKDLDFTDTKTRPLNAFFGGSCELVSNLGTLTIEVSTENGCFKQQYQVSGEIDIELPPQKYLVQVKDVQTGDTNLRADMIQYFDDLGVQEIDLTNATDTLDLTYHAPISMTITGFPAPPTGQCSVYTTAEGGTLPLVSLLRQGASYNVTLNVSEDYGLGRICPVNYGTVAVYDAVADSANIKRVYEIEDGKVQHRTLAASPNVFKGASVGGVDRSYQKSFTGVAEVPGRDPLVKTDWVIVEGVRARTAEFVSATSEPFPLLIVHDPPGTNSSAYLEEGTSQCVTMTRMEVFGGAVGASFDVTLGVELEIGFVVSTESGGGFKATGKTVLGGSDGQKSGIEICATTTEKFSTSGDIGWSGEDVFMGVAMNLIFARADELDVDQCEVSVTERLAADLDTENAFETIYTYGSTHIRDSLIPDLAELIELSGGDPSVSGDPDNDGTEETIRLSEALANWKAQLANNELLKAQGLDGTVVNRSFSAGADYEYSHSSGSTRTSTETSKFYIKSENSLGGTVKLLGYDQTFQAILEFNYELVNEKEASTGSTTTTGYTLSDGDTGDFFSVDVGTDPRYGTPVFGTVSGRSSNPWEANTQRRDWPL
ncbi:MAG: LamG domain-containing protein, partial [Rhodothermales bacterium]|nr:LamG domain-containing protein [Rhodothermales bacterium]